MTDQPEGRPPMTPLTALRLDVAQEKVEEYSRALAEVSPGVVAEVLARLDAGIAHAERTGEVAALRHLLDSLLMTARLGRNDAYLRSVADADAEDRSGVGDGEDVAAFVARMRAKHEG